MKQIFLGFLILASSNCMAFCSLTDQQCQQNERMIQLQQQQLRQQQAYQQEQLRMQTQEQVNNSFSQSNQFNRCHRYDAVSGRCSF